MFHHTTPPNRLQYSGLLLCFAAGLALAALTVVAHADTAIPAGTTRFQATTPGDYLLDTGVTRSVTSGGNEVVQLGSAAAGTYKLTVNGTATQTGSGRGIRTSTDLVNFTINIGTTGLVKAVVDDAIQGRGGPVNLTNSGTLYSGANLAALPTAPIVTGRGLNLRDASGATVVNNATGLIRADGGDAVRVGANATFTNYGTILAAGVVNDASSNNAFNTAPNNSVAENFSAGGGFSFEDPSGSVGSTNSSLDNFGTISGARHGVQAGTLGSNLTVTNEVGGTIIGRNGSGVGFDSVETDPSKIVINNSGLIRGDYAGAGNIIDRTGNKSFTNDGDGDGVDIDGAATIHNYATGQILATGAGGFDSGGRANASDGISIGGGVVTNEGLIRGATVGIVANNDSTTSRSGVAATTITNAATGTIEGQNGYAIRLENKLGDARDNDTLINAGTIIGGGAIPAPAGVVTLQNGTVDTHSTGTLDGVAYTGTGNARFIKGDGSAVQMGEGKDTLINTGTITGSNGRAINMEGGDDAVKINGGAINGAINGGAGTDTLSFDLGSPATVFKQNGAITNFEQIDLVSGDVQLAGAFALGANANALTVHGGAILDLLNQSLLLEQGSVKVDGALTFSLNGAADYGQLQFGAANGGGLTLGAGSSLVLDLGYTPVIGQDFTLVSFGGGSAYLSGLFAGLAEGAWFVADDLHFRISYAGNGGHDIVITRTVPDTGATLALLGGAVGVLACFRRRRLA